MKSTALAASSVAAAALTLLAIGLLDRPVAEFVRASGVEHAWFFDQGTAFLDALSGKEISKFLLGLVLIAAGGLLLVARPARRHGIATLFVGLVQLLGTLVCGVSKNAFGRLRPYEVLGTERWDHAWFAGGSSFPSGHMGFYFGLFLPLACLFPRWRWWLMVVPAFIGLARIDANDHFLGDVTASVALVSLLALATATAMRRWLRPAPTAVRC